MSGGRNNSAMSRLRLDYMRLKKDPIPYIVAEPLPSNILEWHYVVTGPPSSPYHGGQYHGNYQRPSKDISVTTHYYPFTGKLVFPSEFPFRPPSIYMITPNGRFKTNYRLCLSISDYHPDTWNPSWTVATILTGEVSYYNDKTSV